MLMFFSSVTEIKDISMGKKRMIFQMICQKISDPLFVNPGSTKIVNVGLKKLIQTNQRAKSYFN